VIARILKDSRIVKITPRLRRICSEAEYNLEAHSVEKILRFGTQYDVCFMVLSSALISLSARVDNVCGNVDALVKTMLITFPYYNNYVDLVRLELSALSSLAIEKPRRKYAVLSSGPLPLMSIYLADALNKDAHQFIYIHSVDQDPWAISTSAELCRKLGYSPTKICFHCVDVKSHSIDFMDFDVMHLAALVGMSTKAVRVQLVSELDP
jgi:nicotianamine synthase